MLDLEVHPERGLVCPKDDWELVLGMPLNQAIETLRRVDSTVRSVQLWYSDRLPKHMDIVLSLTHDGVTLSFDPIHQRLKMIEVFDLSKLRLSYCGQCFNEQPSLLPTLSAVQECFGATHPLDHDQEKDRDVLSFRGVSFTFPRNDVSLRASAADDASSFTYFAGGASFEEPDDCAAPSGVLADGMFVFLGSLLSEPRAPASLPLECFRGRVRLERLLLARDRGVTKEFRLQLCCEDTAPTAAAAACSSQRCDFQRVIRFGDSIQDVESCLGSPSDIFYKSEDKMKIHAKDSAKWRMRARRSDYFYNYFDLGIDLLFDGSTHSLVKVILHTNFPGHYNFSTYCRCFFELALGSPGSEHVAGSLGSADDSLDAASTPRAGANLEVNQFSRWDEISDFLGKQADRPVVLNRHDSTNTVNPFGATYYYGCEDLIFEVMPNNGHLASLTVYQTQFW